MGRACDQCHGTDMQYDCARGNCYADYMAEMRAAAEAEEEARYQAEWEAHMQAQWEAGQASAERGDAHD